MIVDTSVLLAYFDGRERLHEAATDVIEGSNDTLVVSPYIVAELDYLVLTRHGVDAECRVLHELSSGAYVLAAMSGGLFTEAVDIVERFADQGIGIADASNIALAQAFGTTTIATLDQRHFSMLRFRDGSAPVIVPS